MLTLNSFRNGTENQIYNGMSALHVIDIKICTTKKKYVPVFQVEVKFVQLYYAVFIVMFKHV